MKASLPDVNVLLALAWPNHQFHDQARSWYRRAHATGWATCAVTQLGFIRLSSNPAFTPYAKTPAEATHLLGQLVAQPSHRFVAELGAPADDPFRAMSRNLLGHRQITDAYLVGAALTHNLRLVSFDRKIQHVAIEPDAIEILPAGEDAP